MSAQTRPTPLNDHRDANDAIESLEAGIKQMAMFLSKFDAHARTHLAAMSENLTATERRLAVLEAKAQSATTATPVSSLSNDNSAHVSQTNIGTSVPEERILDGEIAPSARIEGDNEDTPIRDIAQITHSE
ncbi:hypothetical protein DFS34DRAFT_651600 [Phlyctochytrium arcticum]|nr:hypothetical protein DFS34DRAFT_651600 [Phlyctochytrium arcticum]